MKNLLKFLYLLLFLMVALLLAGLFLPDYYSINSQISINAKGEIVYGQISDLEKWKGWTPWLTNDSTVNISYGEKTVGEGSSFAWTSAEYGNGSVLLTSCTGNESVEGEMELYNFGHTSFKYQLRNKGAGTLLKCEIINTDIGYFERYFTLLFRKKLEGSYREALEKIKTQAEELRLSRISEPTIIASSPRIFLLIRDTVSVDQFNESHTTNLGRIRRFLERRKVDVVGDPLAVFYSYTPGKETIFASGYEISKKTYSWKDYQCVVVDSCRIATLTHWGNYSSAKPYLALDDYLSQNQLEQDSFIWETYQITPEEEPDTSEWKKQLFYPIKED